MITRGGTNEERLYLYDLKFDCGDDIVVVRHTDMPDIYGLITRHKARYHLVTGFCRHNDIILDFPCGSGYGSEIILSNFYEGRDNDEISIAYAEHFYRGNFKIDDLTNPHLKDRTYNVIACIEGLEHIEQMHQGRLIKYFYDALVHGGTLVITTPEREGAITNPYHKWELGKLEFEALLKEQFRDVQILVQKDIDHTGKKTRFLYGIARKGD